MPGHNTPSCSYAFWFGDFGVCLRSNLVNRCLPLLCADDTTGMEIPNLTLAVAGSTVVPAVGAAYDELAECVPLAER